MRYMNNSYRYTRLKLGKNILHLWALYLTKCQDLRSSKLIKRLSKNKEKLS